MPTDHNFMDPMQVIATELSNAHVKLVPIDMQHAVDLQESVDDSAFAFMAMRSSIKTKNEVRRYIEFQQSRANTLAFAVIDQSTGKAIGSTSYMNIRAEHRGLEIGSTWIAQSARGTKINPSMKYLMLKHAFEDLGAIRVELCTDERNAQSRAAIEKLGASFEGLMINHIIMPDAHLRTTASYAITPDEWESVKERLLTRINS